MEKKIQKATAAVEAARAELAKRGALHSRAREALDVVDVDAKEFRNAYFAADAARIGVERASLALAAREGELEARQRERTLAAYNAAAERSTAAFAIASVRPQIERLTALRLEAEKIAASFVRAAGAAADASREATALARELGLEASHPAIDCWAIVAASDDALRALAKARREKGETTPELGILNAGRILEHTNAAA